MPEPKATTDMFSFHKLLSGMTAPSLLVWALVSSSLAVSGCDGGGSKLPVGDGGADADWEDCAPGTYMEDLALGWRCLPCPAGTFSAEESSASCAPWTSASCAPGSYVTSWGSATTDHQCSPCPLGTLSTSEDAVGCIELSQTACAPGSYAAYGPDDDGYRLCEPCPGGSYSAEEDASSCAPWAEPDCVPGELQATAPSSVSDRICEPCAEGSFTVEVNAASCASWTSAACVPGTHVASQGSTTTDHTCIACPDGTFSTTIDASECVEFMEGSCVPGSYVVREPDATGERVCADCAEGTFSSTENAASCTAWSAPDCGDGQYEAAAPSAISDRVCLACPAKTYSVGVNASSCIAWTDPQCDPGRYVVSQGSQTTDHECAPCPEGTFASTVDESECHPHTALCPAARIDLGEPTATRDRICARLQDATEWVIQYGSYFDDQISEIAVDASENVFVVGNTQGSIYGTNLGYNDGFLEKRTSSGAWLWGRKIGTDRNDHVWSLAVGPLGEVYAVGTTEGTLGESRFGNRDAFVRKFSADGDVLWTRQFGLALHDEARGVAVDAAGDVYVVGQLWAGTAAPYQEAFIRKYDASGEELWTDVFGTPTTDLATSVSVDAWGNVYVSGYTYGALVDESGGNSDAFVRKYDADGVEQWTRQFGNSELDQVYSIDVDAGGNVYVAGYTGGSLGAPNAGLTDALIRKYDPDGVEQWTRQLGGTGYDDLYSVTVDGAGHVYAAGYTQNSIGSVNAGGYDILVLKYSPDGDAEWKRQIGQNKNDYALSVAVGSSGTIYVGGITNGVLGASNVSGYADALILALVP
jgi:hypothetical protein